MKASHSDVYSNKVGNIFDVRPRIAVDDLSRWIVRNEEKYFRNAITCPGSHVCLYGPSGSGKTSLSKTILARLKRRGYKFVYTRINHNSTWYSFKSQILENKQSKKETDKTYGVKIGINNLLPYFEINREIKKEKNEPTSRASIVEALDIPTIAQFLIDSNIILTIDDSNFASDELLLMLTSLAKEILDNSENSKAKIIFVGADDIFLRILKTNDSLKDRTEEIALGSVRDYNNGSDISSDRVWKFIADGITQLGLQDPRKDKFLNKIQISECIQWINNAADGLPKSIVRLGRIIAEKGERRSRVSYSDIKNSAIEMTRKNFRLYRTQYRTLIHSLRRDQLLQDVCEWMFKNGASKIHRLDDIAEDLIEIATYSLIERAISILAETDYIVTTGIENNVFFAKDPLLAHTIGVALRNPTICDVDNTFFGKNGDARQLLLRFTGPKDPEHRPKIVTG